MSENKDFRIEKMVISQDYNFSTLWYFNVFTLDFREKKAQCSYFPHDDTIPMDFYKSQSSKENHKLNVKFWKSSNYKLIYLTEKQLDDFLNDFESLDLFENYKPSISKGFSDKFGNIGMLSKCSVEIFYENDDVEKFKFVDNFPKNWIGFGKILENLVGFDVLNIGNLRYLICELHFDIKSDGVYLDGKKLNLTKIYYYRGGIYGPLGYNFAIDLINKSLNYPRMGHLDYPAEEIYKNLTDDEISCILDLIEKCSVCRWYHKDYLNRIDAYEYPRIFFDGVHWYMELVFENKYVLHLGGHSEYPDTYMYFGRKIKELFGVDLFYIDKIGDDISGDFEFWENKLID